MIHPTTAELAKLLDEHNAIQDFSERVMHEAPYIRITRRCRQCGSELADFDVGWSEIEFAVAHNEPIPDHFETASCHKCEPDEKED